MPELQLRKRTVAIDSLHPYPGNPRRGDVELIKTSLRANGQFRPIVVREKTSEILAGNHTWQAARELGWRKIAIVTVDVDDAQARRILLADNATADSAKYDDQALAKLLAETAKSKGGLDGSGFTDDQFAGLLQRTAQMPATPDPDPKPKPKRPRTKRGQVVELGEHRLICGDSTDSGVLAEMMAGDTADMIWTDPPYGVDYASNLAWRSFGGAGRSSPRAASAANDTFGGDKPEEYEQLIRDVFTAAREHVRVGGAFYCAFADSMRGPTIRAIEGAGWEWKQTLVWVKNAATFSRQDYQWRHEPIAYGWRSGGSHKWYGGWTNTTVIEGATREAVAALEHDDLVEIVWRLLEEKPGTVVRVDRPSSADLHPTMKPTALIGPQIRNSSPPGGIVLEPFGGSGSTLVAAQRAGRRARLVEIDPGYCDVIRDRYERLVEAETKEAA